MQLCFMNAFSGFNCVQSWEEGSTEDSDNQMTPLGVPEESSTTSTEKRAMKTIVEKMELTNMSVTQADG